MAHQNQWDGDCCCPLLTSGIQLVGRLATGIALGGPELGAWEALKKIAPKALAEFASSGVAILGEKAGLPGPVSSFLATAASSGVSAFGANFIASRAPPVTGYRSDGSMITVSNPLNHGESILGSGFGTTVQKTLVSARLDVEGSGGGIFIPAAQILEQEANQPGLLSRIFSSFKGAAISSVNFVGNMVGNVIDHVVNLGQEISNNSLLSILEKYATQIFDRQTIEAIVNTAGGIGEILNRSAQRIKLPTGITANAYAFSGTTSLLVDDAQNLVGQIRNGRYELGHLGIDRHGKVFVKNGVLLEDIEGQRVHTTVTDGKVQRITIENPQREVLVDIEGTEGPIFIEGPEGENIANGVFKLLKQELEFVLKNGSVIQLISRIATEPADKVDVPQSEGEEVDITNRRTYLLNGIGNVNPVEEGAPEYMVRLRNILRDVYGFADTALVGLYQGIDFPAEKADQLLGIDTWIRELLPFGLVGDTLKIFSKIMADLSAGIIKAGDTINVVAYSGGAQRIVDASWFLPVNINLIAYGGPIVAGVIPARIRNILPIWGTEDEVKFLEPLLRFSIAPGNIMPTDWWYGAHHFDQPEQNKWGYHCGDVTVCNQNGKSFIEILAEKINAFFEFVGIA